MRSSAYNNNVMIFQSSGYVTILNEMVHNARVIPIDNAPDLPFDQKSGVSRAHWDGQTLVIETDQFAGGSSGLTSTNMHLVERLTRIDADTVAYEFTVNDAPTWTRPWTVAFPLSRMQDEIYEYACHEGNYSIAGVLGGARADETRADDR